MFALRLCALLVLTPCAWLSTQIQATKAKHSNFYGRQTELRNRATAALEQEQKRHDSGYCVGATSDSEIGFCLKSEFAKTSENYIDFVKGLGGLLRLVDVEKAPTVGRITLDDGESAWLLYREKSCDVLGETWEGGSGRAGAQFSCRIDLTFNHMRELREVFGNEWH